MSPLPPNFSWQEPVRGVGIFALMCASTEVARVEMTVHEPPRCLVTVDNHLPKHKAAYTRELATGRRWAILWARRERERLLAEAAAIDAKRAGWTRP